MQYRKLGRTDIEVSVVAMGCWAIVGDWVWGEQDESEALRAIDAALEAGINFFDTAEAYGDGYSEQLLGRALKQRRQQVVIATKVSAKNLQRADVVAACDASLQRLGTDYIDLYQIHWPNWNIRLEETCAALEKLRDSGKIRAIGVSNFGAGDLSDAINQTRIETNQIAYSLLLRAIEYDIQPMCRDHGIGMLCYSPLAQGLLTGKFEKADDVPAGRARTRHFSHERQHARHGEAGCEQATFDAIQRIRDISARLDQPMSRVALAWLLHQPAVTSVVAGGRNPAQVQENAQAAALSLNADALAELDEATQPVKKALGDNPDPWQSGAQCRMR